MELLLDNDTAFRSHVFREFTEGWNVRLRFRCAYVPAGNGIVERCHRSVKRIAARKGCSVQEAVYWYNLAPLDDSSAASAPANQVYCYEVRVRGVDVCPVSEGIVAGCPFSVGDAVWVKPPDARCTTQFGSGHVTGIVSDCAVEVDGVPRHVKDLRLRLQPEAASQAGQEVVECSDARVVGCDEALMVLGSGDPGVSPQNGDASGTSNGVVSDCRPLSLRRTPRNAGPPDRYAYVWCSS